MSAVSKRYARAAVEAADEAGGPEAVEALASGLTKFATLFGESEELREVLANPELREHRDAVLDAILGKVQADALVGKLVRLLSENRRLDLVGEVAAQAELIADDRAGRVRARVASATPLTDSQVDRIARGLERRVGRPVVVSVEVDSEILGGLVCQVGDLTFDSSLKRQIAALREQLEANVL